MREWQCRFAWWPGVIRESHCKWLNALEWWLPGVAGLRMAALCYWGMRLKVSMEVRCYWGMAMQVCMVARCY